MEKLNFDTNVLDDETEVDCSHREVSADGGNRRTVNSNLGIGDQNQVQNQFDDDTAVHGDHGLSLQAK